MAGTDWTKVAKPARLGNCLKRWFDVFKTAGIATNHQAVAVFTARQAAGGAYIEKVEVMVGLQGLATADGVGVVRIAAVDNNVAVLKDGSQILNHFFCRVTGRHHYPDNPRFW